MEPYPVCGWQTNSSSVTSTGVWCYGANYLNGTSACEVNPQHSGPNEFFLRAGDSVFTGMVCPSGYKDVNGACQLDESGPYGVAMWPSDGNPSSIPDGLGKMIPHPRDPDVGHQDNPLPSDGLSLSGKDQYGNSQKIDVKPNAQGGTDITVQSQGQNAQGVTQTAIQKFVTDAYGQITDINNTVLDAAIPDIGATGGTGTGSGSSQTVVNVNTCGTPTTPPCKIDETGTPATYTAPDLFQDNTSLQGDSSSGSGLYGQAIKKIGEMVADTQFDQIKNETVSLISLPGQSGTCTAADDPDFDFTVPGGQSYHVAYGFCEKMATWRLVWQYVLYIYAAWAIMQMFHQQDWGK